MSENSQPRQEERKTDAAPLVRRNFLLGGFVASLAGAYGAFAAFALQFIFPERVERPPIRIFLGFTHEMDEGESRVVTMPSGDQMLLSNTGRRDPASGGTFAAYSSRCPHLGCKVHWDAGEGVFLCPCHQGVFRPDGVATGGPPAQAGQSLTPYQLEIKGKSIYALVEGA